MSWTPENDYDEPPDTDGDDGGPDDWETSDDDDESVTVDCPACRRQISELAERCPHCGEWVTHGHSPARQRGWLTIAIVIIVIGGLLAIWRWAG